MRNPSILFWAFLGALIAFPVVDSAPRTTDDQQRAPSPPSSTSTNAPQGDVLVSRARHNLVISADGAWMAAEERPDRGDGNVRVWSTERDVTFTIERGQNPRISRDSRWVSALQKPPLEDSRTVTPTNQRAGQTLVLLDTQNGSRRTFDFVLSYDVAYASTYLIYLQSPKTEAAEEEPSKDKATEPTAQQAAKERNVGTLHLVHLESDRVSAAIENVAQHVIHQTHATHQTTDHFAYVLHDEETGRDTLNIIALGRTGGWGYRGTYEGGKIEGLCWARDPITVGFLDSTETTGKDGKRRMNSALYTWHVTGPNVAGKFTRVDTPRHLELKNGLKIENGINRGTGYTDSLGNDYNLRYMPIAITNNNTIPIHLHISFSKDYDYPSPYSDEQFKVIPLPKEWAQDGVEITNSMINELPKYIDEPSVNKTLEPGEEFVTALGTRYRPTGRGIVPNVLFVQSDSAKFQACGSQLNLGKSTNSQSTLGLKLDIYLTGTRDPSACILIPCGHISHPEH